MYTSVLMPEDSRNVGSKKKKKRRKKAAWITYSGNDCLIINIPAW